MPFVKIQPITEKIATCETESRDSSFDLINTTETTLRIGIEAVGENATWVQIAPLQRELKLPPRGLEKIQVIVTPPAGTAGCSTAFRLRVYRIEDPHQSVVSPHVGIEVSSLPPPSLPPRPSPPPPRPNRRWGVLIGVAGSLTLAGGILAFVAIHHEVPDLSGMTRSEAVNLLQKSKLTPLVTEELGEAEEADRVLRQEPAAGERLPSDRVIRVVIAVASVEVPSLLGLRLDEARTRLAGRELPLEEPTFEKTGSAPAGTVIGQAPSPGVRVMPGSAVRLVLEKMPSAVVPAPPVVVPPNLLRNPDASLGGQEWSTEGQAQIDRLGSNLCFSVRNGGSFSQDVALPPDAAGRYALLIGRVSSERINANGSSTGLPYLYGYMMSGGRDIKAYLQGQSLLSSASRIDQWVVAWGIFAIPTGTNMVRFFLGQAERRGDPHNGSAARFDDLGLYITPDEATARKIVDRYSSIYMP